MRIVLSAILMFAAVVGFGQETKKSPKKTEVSFKSDVFPIIEKRCMPCHAEENFNPSELSLDTYDLLMTGGKNGEAIVPGKPDKSTLVKKLSDEPPFGERMPLNPKKKVKEGKAKWLSEDEVKAIATWIEQGAKKN